MYFLIKGFPRLCAELLPFAGKADARVEPCPYSESHRSCRSDLDKHAALLVSFDAFPAGQYF